MFGSDILDVALGLVFVYLLMSLIATAAREAAEAALKSRGRWLEKGLMELFEHKPGQETLLVRFYNYPLIYSLFRRPYQAPESRASTVGGKLPSYIPSAHFANAMLGVAESYLKDGTGGQPLSHDRLTLAAWAVPNEPVRRVLLQALATAKGDLDQTLAFLEIWYDGTMDRVAGWYRRESQMYVFYGGLALCIALNVNTMLIAHSLHESRVLRQSVGTAAKKWVDDHAATAVPAQDPGKADAWFTAAQLPYQQLSALALPIGWGSAMQTAMVSDLLPPLPPGQHRGWFKATLIFVLGGLEILSGWLMTALAITLGAPFWFDVLNTIMVVRSTVKPAEKSGEEASKDGPGAVPPPPVHSGQQPGPTQKPPPLLSTPATGAIEIASLDPALRPREED